MKCSFFKVAFFALIFSTVSNVFSDTTHEVQKGETLYSISRNYGVSVDVIRSANGLADNAIKVGQKLKIPGSAVAQTQPTKSAAAQAESAAFAQTADGTYTVQKGETWFGISKKYGVSVADLQKLNEAGSDAPLKVGQKLKVPASSSSSTATAKATSSASSQGSGSKAGGSSVSQTKVPDLAKNDPHNYSNKKADTSLVWPVKTESIVYINGKVGGVSLATKKDEEVKAIRAGTVMFSGSYRGFGNVVFIQSKTGHIYAYTGLGSIDVSKGDYINYSSEIGRAGIDTYTGKSQISLMVFQNGQPIDPAKAPRG